MPAEHRYKWEDVKRGVLLSCAFFQGLHLEGRPVRWVNAWVWWGIYWITRQMAWRRPRTRMWPRWLIDRGWLKVQPCHNPVCSAELKCQAKSWFWCDGSMRLATAASAWHCTLSESIQSIGFILRSEIRTATVHNWPNLAGYSLPLA